jgi:prepilin-type N-terminal cleavage/methylation domain-containing protein
MLRKPLNSQGFSLLEVIVAMAIMGVGFVTVLHLFSEGIRSLDYSDQYMKAITLANNKLTELELTDFEADAFSGVFANEETYSWEMTITPYESILNDPLENIQLMQVALKVTWTDLSRERSVELASIKTKGKSYSAADLVIMGTNKGERLKQAQATPPTPSGAPAGTGTSGAVGAPSQNISGALTGGGPQNVSGAISAPGGAQPNVSGAGGAVGISGAP